MLPFLTKGLVHFGKYFIHNNAVTILELYVFGMFVLSNAHFHLNNTWNLKLFWQQILCKSSLRYLNLKSLL